MTIDKKYIPLLFSILTAVVFVFYFFIQPTTDYSLCPKCDANQYLAIVNKFSGNDFSSIEYPYHNRILIPLIVSALPLTPILGFHIINFLAAVAFIYILTLLLVSMNVKIEIISLFFIWITIHYAGIIRLSILDPISIDSTTYLFQILLVYVLYHKKYTHLLWLSPLGTIQKESFLAFQIIIFLYTIALYLFNDREKLPFQTIFFATILSLFVKLLVNQFVLPIETHHNEVRTLFLHVYLSIIDPSRIIKYILSYYTVYGLFLIISIKKGYDWKIKNHFDQLILLLGFTSLGFGILGGGDTTRIMLLGFPFIVFAIILSLKTINLKHWMLLFIISIPALKFWNNITPISENRIIFNDWFIERASINSTIIWGLIAVGSYIAYEIVLYGFFRNKKA